MGKNLPQASRATGKKPRFLVAEFYKSPGLLPEDLNRIAAAHEYREFKKGSLLLQEGQRADAYYCLDLGMIRSFATNPSGDAITTGFTGPGEIAIEVASLFLGLPTEENMQALTDCRVWRIRLEAFQQLFNEIPAFATWGREWMTQALLTHKLRALRMITETARERYLRLQEEQPEIVKVVPLKYIASYLGITDSSLSRIRKEIRG
ncbi:Crp/Fnr family transcriptional regulator [Cyclobacterium xiamenense]|uniref:Crp/Fnr family transcriptional regulator n=1 Tax=Cyclobacterium xiamenense TaxID=1297121 RepID=UPI0035D11460